MPRKSMIMLGMFLGSVVGGIVPTLLGADSISIACLLGSTAGGVLGIWLAYRYTA